MIQTIIFGIFWKNTTYVFDQADIESDTRLLTTSHPVKISLSLSYLIRGGKNMIQKKFGKIMKKIHHSFFCDIIP